jgi:hypothetical protein
MDAITFLVLAAAAMAGIALFNGVASMAHGGEYDLEHAHELMFRRVGWQALAVLFLLVALIRF